MFEPNYASAVLPWLVIIFPVSQNAEALCTNFLSESIYEEAPETLVVNKGCEKNLGVEATISDGRITTRGESRADLRRSLDPPWR